MSRALRRTFATFLAITMIIALQMPAIGQAADLSLTETSSSPLGEGTTLHEYRASVGGKTSLVHVTTVDLHNQYVQVGPVYGTAGKLTNKQTVKGMADERGAVAAVNADFFRMDRKGAPFGIVLDKGKLVSSMGKINNWYSFGILNDNTAIVAHMNFQGTLETPDGATSDIMGVNKEEYNPTNDKSHLGKINLYTSDFGTTSLGAIKGYESAVEMLVVDDHVSDIRIGNPGYTIPSNGYVLWGDGAGKQFLLDHLHIGDAVKTTLQTTPDVALGDRSLVSAVGGNMLLVKDGQALTNIPSDNIAGLVARTAFGVSQDGKTLYIVAVESSSRSTGMTLDTLAQLLQQLGAYNAANFDGGGSTTMVARYPGDKQTTLLNTPAAGAMRQVPTGLAVFNTAPPGDFANFLYTTNGKTTLGKSLPITVKAYDTHYNPFDLNPSNITWSADPADGTFTGNVFTPKRSGQIKITGEYKGLKKDLTLTVANIPDVQDLVVNPSPVAVDPNGQVTFSVALKTKSGDLIPATQDMIKASVSPDLGIVSGFTFTAGSEQKTGSMQVQYGSITRNVPVIIGTMWSSWNAANALSNPTYTTTPASLAPQGSFRLTTGDEPVNGSTKALRLQYSYAGAPNTSMRFAYGNFGTAGVTLPGQPLGIKLSVNGDNSGHWLRAQLADASGQIYYVDLAKQIDWSGWKEVQGQFPSGMKYPVALRSLYVVDQEDSTLSEQGTLYFDSFALKYPNSPAPAPAPAPTPVPAPAPKPVPAPTPVPPKQDGPGNSSAAFSDLKGHWAEATVMNMFKKGIVSGISANKMGPNLPVTRGQFVVFMDRAFGWTKGKAPSGKLSFKDSIPAYAQASVQAAVSKKIISGMTDGTFQADKPITRAEMAVIMYNALKQGYGTDHSPSASVSSYKDFASIPAYARSKVQYLTQRGFVYGSEGMFHPQNSATRAEALVILNRLLND
ncbi:phosphodiester glycosidase family protein [Aneurinibacillus sp. Ricciae_BoGa-3]|uniref:phosphodiester glycosidase family protein n=1 Tax=Aneurinibacillus sp. Ricciae_BoGa-3 TaxID=3022697 RepID=UPI002340A89F|nr:phosphodiester glycosidase family protein [Aneurinibacillus sp. Ricciae_BoGa-3]WCK54352.1 phosphodiester glycosidase family protein [Aneurinibacillus sp. Ricciae_BoGa-3]